MSGETAIPLPIYMDYQASTPLDPRVLTAMMPFLQGGFGNPHAADHAYGWDADFAITAARGKVARLISADADEIIFTSGATEANNLAVIGAAKAAPLTRRRIVVSATEHKCVLAAARALAQEGFEVVPIPATSDGLIDLDAIRIAVDTRTAFASVMAINNEIGIAQPLAEVAAICQASGALFHVDAAQALAVSAVSVDQYGADFVSLSAHKAYGPKGIGALYVRREQAGRLRPLLHGGGQEQGLRPGTLPTPLCVGFGAACEILEAERAQDVARIMGLRDRFLSNLLAHLPTLRVNGTLDGRHPGNLNIRIPGIEASLLLAAIQSKIAAASGSACTSGTPEPSHVLRAIGLSNEEADESIRLSLGRYTSPDDIETATITLTEAIEEIRKRFQQ